VVLFHLAKRAIGLGRRPVWSFLFLVLAFALPACGTVGQPSAAELFGTKTLIAQVHPHHKEWLVAGLACPQPATTCSVPDVVLGGAVLQQGDWRVRLLIRLATSYQSAPDPCVAQLTDNIVPEEDVIVVGCLDGGSDAESFVAVLGFNPGGSLPQLLLSLDCGSTRWKVRGSSLIIESSGLLSGPITSPVSHPNVIVTWQGGAATSQGNALGSLLPVSAVYGVQDTPWPSFCSPVGPWSMSLSLPF
jgi:hypothetical protein